MFIGPTPCRKSCLLPPGSAVRSATALRDTGFSRKLSKELLSGIRNSRCQRKNCFLKPIGTKSVTEGKAAGALSSLSISLWEESGPRIPSRIPRFLLSPRYHDGVAPAEGLRIPVMRSHPWGSFFFSHQLPPVSCDLPGRLQDSSLSYRNFVIFIHFIEIIRAFPCVFSVFSPFNALRKGWIPWRILVISIWIKKKISS